MDLEIRPHSNKIAAFAVLSLLLLMISRVTNVFVYGNWQDIIQNLVFLDNFILKGLRFDLKLLSSSLIVFVWLPLLFFSCTLPRKWFENYLQSVLKVNLVILTFIIFLDEGYIYYFQKPIDVLIFGIIEDDTGAVFSILVDNYKILLFLVLFVVVSYCVIWLFSALSSRIKFRSEKASSTSKQLVIFIVSLLLLASLARGSTDTFPLQRKHASVSDDVFLNSMVMNSGFNLYYAYHDKGENNEAVFRQNILKSNKFESVEQLIKKAGYDEKHPLIRTTSANENLEKIKPHVIFVLMEGWSAEVARKQSVSNNVLGEFAQHAKQDYFFTKFFSNQYTTNSSIEALLMNSPISPLSQSVARKTKFKLSNVLPFKENNYKTLFLSGGNSSWRNHNQFWLQQGFDAYTGRSEIENHYHVDASDNPWGVYDEYLFEYLKKSINDAEKDGQSLFSFVLTTNNHPPVRLPASYVMPALDPSVYGFDAGSSEKRSILSGFHYQTDQLGRFISWIKSSELKDKVIIVATGDHPLRTFTKNTANTEKYLRYSVPAYFYVPEGLGSLKSVSSEIAASHNDIFPMLFELSLSKSRYYNFGSSLMDKDRSKSYGWNSSGEFVFSDGVVDSRNNKFYAWADETKALLGYKMQPVSKDKHLAIERERYRDTLKKYLLVNDYQEQTK